MEAGRQDGGTSKGSALLWGSQPLLHSMLLSVSQKVEVKERLRGQSLLIAGGQKSSRGSPAAFFCHLVPLPAAGYGLGD